MKKLIIISLFIFSLFITNASVMKIEKIGIINLQRVIEVCFQGKSSAVRKVIEEKEEFQKQLDEIRGRITDLQTKLSGETNQAIKEDLSKKIEESRREYTELFRRRSPEIERMERSIQAPLFEEIYDVVRRIAEREGYSIIVRSNSDTLFYYSANSEITDKVIEHFNNQ